MPFPVAAPGYSGIFYSYPLINEILMFKHKKPLLKGFSRNAFLTRMNAVWFGGKMNDAQADCLGGFVSAWLIYNSVLGKNIPISWLAYVLATVYHETASTMEPIEEYGKGAGHSYGEPDPETGQVYDGRGYVQLTWKDNYQKAQDNVVDFRTMKCDVPLVAQPDLAMTPWVAAQVAIIGMSQGWFTSKKLGDYLTEFATDYVNARRIINGTDKAATIAAYAQEVEAAIRLALGQGITRSMIMSGSKGDDVRELQLMLALSPDGVAGNDTVNAIMAFQTKNFLQVDGICGQDTWATLGREIYQL